MKKLILSIPFFFIGILLVAQPALQEVNDPVMAFESEIIDYGTLEQGADGVREFKFTNTGNAPLIISEARKSCGCTVPSFPKEPINPGESAAIKVKYDTKRLGIINKSVTIVSNAKRPNIVLRIKGKVVAPDTLPVAEGNMLKAN